ncbi:MAG: hypothetical protein V4515_12605 [Chloroflexota bacterium]
MNTVLDVLTVPLADLAHTTDSALDEAICKVVEAAEEEQAKSVSAFNSAI